MRIDDTNSSTSKIIKDRITINETDKNGKLFFDPILRYIEGYAYNNQGKLIPKAKVEVKLTMNNKVFFSTTADENGFFIIYQNNLPPFEYYLTFIDPITKETTKQTTSEFVKKNKEYLQSENINLMTATKNSRPIINPTINKLVMSKSNINSTNNYLSKTNKLENLFKKQNNNFFPKLLIILVIILFLIISFIFVLIYIKKTDKKPLV